MLLQIDNVQLKMVYFQPQILVATSSFYWCFLCLSCVQPVLFASTLICLSCVMFLVCLHVSFLFSIWLSSVISGRTANLLPASTSCVYTVYSYAANVYAVYGYAAYSYAV